MADRDRKAKGEQEGFKRDRKIIKSTGAHVGPQWETGELRRRRENQWCRGGESGVQIEKVLVESSRILEFERLGYYAPEAV